MKTLAGIVLTTAILAGVARTSHAQVPPERILEGAFSGAIREAMTHEFAGLTSEFSDGWGHQARVWTGEVKLVTQGIKSRFERIYRDRNDGTWVRGWARLENARDEFDIRFRDFRAVPGRLEIRFQVYIRAYFRAFAEARQYKMGAQLWGIDAEGRARAHIYLNMRAYIYDNGQRLGWEVEDAGVKYSDLVVDRVGHLGGTGARLLGDAITGAIERWFPEKEREAIAKAESSINRALNGSQPIRNDLAQVIRIVAGATGLYPR